MNAVFNLFRRGRPSSLLGLALDGQHLRCILLRRVNLALQASAPLSAPLSIDLLGGEPELAGREILNLLEGAGIQERRCAVVIPLKWALTAQTVLPELPEADAQSLLQIEAEGAFPCDVDNLQMATSRGVATGGEQIVTLVGVPKTHIEKLGLVLRAARLTPVSYSAGISALQPPDSPSSEGVLAIGIGDDRVDLQVTGRGGIAALRALDGVVETDGAEPAIQNDRVAREARITLAQLPASLAGSVKRVRIFGPALKANQLADELRPRLEPAGMTVEVVSKYAAGEGGVPSGLAPTPEASLVARLIDGLKPALEFLPPKVSQWQKLVGKYSSGKLKTGGLVAASLAALVLLLFLFQQWRLSRCEAEWAEIAPKVRELQALRQQVRRYQPWYERSYGCMSILKELTAAFPQNGSVTAKTLEVRDLDTVSCTGTAEDNTALLTMLGKLRADKRVNDLRYEQIRGKSPMQFTFNFHWNPGGQGEN